MKYYWLYINSARSTSRLPSSSCTTTIVIHYGLTMHYQYPGRSDLIHKDTVTPSRRRVCSVWEGGVSVLAFDGARRVRRAAGQSGIKWHRGPRCRWSFCTTWTARSDLRHPRYLFRPWRMTTIRRDACTRLSLAILNSRGISHNRSGVVGIGPPGYLSQLGIPAPRVPSVTATCPCIMLHLQHTVHLKTQKAG